MRLIERSAHAESTGKVPPGPPHLPGFVMDRRRFIRGSLTAVGAYAVAVSGVTWLVAPDKAWAVPYDAFDPDLAQTLLVMTRAVYPHAAVGDAHYAVVVKALDAEAAGFEDKSRLDLLRDGAAALDEAAGGSFIDASEDARYAALEGMATTPFFQAIRGKAVVALYNQPEVWAVFGYEGPSYPKGGYLHNGFDDLSWLPDPPPEASPPVED
ncbi:gluconate 2-dehydrogenase subunit 3 family protein [Acuticoccus sp. I52.16.1]|uniref:gluconate 2-dehydrogenase subunit 3 family protein n=1 Tax=Acuticoccus sp. I52.16.1 TaxID=2928472 RepID=UPI001FD41BDB|nr:gluconate 2-dehydrogenase subunit 3 family protein [Acuticoccus sp. I52.16.1]UOM35551.1 gluconate 2-dehydrogenase subunit 3 family protein [Acuticoccus sp. I52.16.1]